ncbi:MAG: outer membrane protein assembly factor BamA [Candidatus Paracaedimonas acanthamoebae]|uniref:Outer membrane protein assembly factor BamA n=1 Tax=Candidatus Paracaedimonas acanthamoebae TaxID=244581 RepID=A0A8J7PXL9_9PROT|nr:outer membrane protein assembly factor BamA [Candidatus Paracaedimonas acanthamoebae]
MIVNSRIRFFFVFVFLMMSEGKISFASTLIQNIQIQGNQRIEKETILAQIDLIPGKMHSQEEIDQALKNLFASGLFADARLESKGSSLIIHVKENPIVNQVVIEGNDKLSDEILKGELQLRPRQVYTLTRLRNDTQRIQDLYRLKGHFAAVVTPQIIKREQNRVDVVFDVKEGLATVVRKIFFIGNKKFSESKLESAIQTKETRWYRFFTADDTFDSDRLAYDKELLRKFYLEHGYADFQIKSAVAELTPDREEFFITFTLEEGERYQIGDIKISSDFKGLDTTTLAKKIPFASGDWYSNKDVEKTLNLLVDELGSLGYAFVDIQPQLQKNIHKHLLDINFIIQEGPKVYINSIDIIGNDRTDDDVIRRELELDEGDAFNSNKMKHSEKRIKDLGFFKKVTVTKQPSDNPDKADIKIEIEEDRTGELSFGGGFSTADGPLADIRFAEHNFRGKGQDLRVGVTYSKRRQEYSFGLTEPYFLGRELMAGFDVYRMTRTRYQDASYDQQIHGLSLLMGYMLSENLSQLWTYTIQSDKVDHLRKNASRFIQAQPRNSTLSSITHTLTYDRRDSKIDPTTGYSISLSNEFAGLGGTLKYLKNQISGSHFYSFSDEWVLETSARYGIMVGLGKKTRIADRYILGGDTLRGFSPGGVSPRDKISKDKDALGGHQFYSGSVELSFPIGLPNEFGVKGATFTDVGSVWHSKEKGPEVFDSRKPRASVGFGVRWKSPIGPLRIDIAKTISKNKLDEKQVVLFGFSTRL